MFFSLPTCYVFKNKSSINILSLNIILLCHKRIDKLSKKVNDCIYVVYTILNLCIKNYHGLHFVYNIPLF